MSLIVTDGSEKVNKIAEIIAKALEDRVLVKDASSFEGTDLLPADVFFLGCEKPQPESFSSLEDMLQHINLANRCCGVFSHASDEAVQYLKDIVKSSEVFIYPEPLSETNPETVDKWIAGVISGRQEAL